MGSPQLLTDHERKTCSFFAAVPTTAKKEN